VQKELNSLTSYFFEDIEEKDAKKMEREECLKIKEEKEFDEIKKKREEELQKMQGDYPFSYGSLIGNKKVTPLRIIFIRQTTKKWGKDIPQTGKIGKTPTFFSPGTLTPKLKVGMEETEKNKAK
jgi:hypothetical protein